MTKHVAGKFRALGNIGDCLLRFGEADEAIKMHQRQLNLARQASDRSLEAAAYGALGVAHRATRNLDKALGFHTQELTLRQEAADLRGECRAHGNLGAVHMALGQYTHAVKCYQEQLERARELGDSGVEAQALGERTPLHPPSTFDYLLLGGPTNHPNTSPEARENKNKKTKEKKKD
jgi:tetratricopeptide (TPR) repeat protein